MSGYVNDYTKLLEVANTKFESIIENANASNFFSRLSELNYSKYLGRYYYNKSLKDEYYNNIIVVPKSGYITQRLVYINPELVGGTEVGVQAVNIVEQDGNITLQDSGAVGFCPLGRFFDSLCYAFGIKVDKTKIDIYSFCDSVLQNFEFVYNRETGLHIPINSANFNNVHVLYIVEDEKTYFDEDLVQAFANAMYNAEWFTVTSGAISDVAEFPLNTYVSYGTIENPFSKTILKNIIDIAYSFPHGELTDARVDLRRNIDEIWDVFSANIGSGYENYPYYVEVVPTGSKNSASVNIAFSFNTSGEISFMNLYMDNYNNNYLQGRVKDTIDPPLNSNNEKISSLNIYVGINPSNEVHVFRSGGSSRVDYLFAGVNNDSSFDYGHRYTIGSIGSVFYSVAKDGITIIDGAKLPTGLDSLSTDYPTWFSNIKNIVGTGVSDIGDELRNLFKIIEFVPLSLLGSLPSPLEQQLTPEDIQQGVVLSPVYIGTLPEIAVKYLTPFPDTNTPINPDIPYIPITPETPENPYYPTIPQYPYPTTPDSPITNPTYPPTNPPAIGGVTPSIPDNPIVNASNGLFTVYNPTMEQLNQFGGYLWGEDIVGILQSIFQNPIDGVISLHILYATPETGAEVPIKVGYLTSSVSAKKVVEQYINIDCGTINVSEYYGNVLDYSPYTKAHIYLPFIGIREINVNEIMGGQVNVNYKVDVLTGSVYASISVFHNAISQVLYVFEGNGGVQLPLTGGNMSRILSGVVTGVAFGALTGGTAGAVVGATGGLLKGASVSKSGSVSSNAGAMGIKYPYIMITHSQAYMANNYNTQYGYPSNLTIQLSACKGYTRVKEVHVENILVATQEEKDMIQTLLRQGVIIE